MSNVIDFLERFGRDADLRHATDDAINEALRAAGVDPAVQPGDCQGRTRNSFSQALLRCGHQCVLHGPCAG